jgi:hypothetical protein
MNDFVVKVLGTEFNIPRTTPNQTISAKTEGKCNA